VLPERDHAREQLGLERGTKILGSFGAIKDYKNIEGLICAFRDLPNPDIRLLVSGVCTDLELERRLATIAKRDSRVLLMNRSMSDDEYSLNVASCDLIVLPYKRILNSGNALFALSLNRPVLVSRSSSMEELAQEFGCQWVRLLPSAGISADEISRAVEWISDRDYSCELSLQKLDWGLIAERTCEFFLLLCNRDGLI
jgi:glycosyltransferase involved in cell wall biosynthesis